MLGATKMIIHFGFNDLLIVTFCTDAPRTPVMAQSLSAAACSPLDHREPSTGLSEAIQ